jgi:hypothetical protein
LIVDEQTIACDILVVGGGLGGIAAALGACRAGRQVCLAAQAPWLGGQCTAQGMSFLGGHAYSERFGFTATFAEFRQRIRSYYRDNYRLKTNARTDAAFNPGNGPKNGESNNKTNGLAFEPRAAWSALLQMLLPHIEAGRLHLFHDAVAHSGQMDGRRVTRLSFEQATYQRRLHFDATYFLDATPLGDLAALLGLPYITGAESRELTGEDHARADAGAPHLSQRFSFPFAVDFRPGENHTIDRPRHYETNRAKQPYSLKQTTSQGVGHNDSPDDPVPLFPGMPLPLGIFLARHRLIDTSQFEADQFDGDIALINSPSNAFGAIDLLTTSLTQRHNILDQAKDLSLGFLYWLQTEAPRDDGLGPGYPELRLRTDIMGSADGLSQYPYTREARRIRALKTVVESDIAAACQGGLRATNHSDSVGLGWSSIEIHGRPGDQALSGPTRPFQIPLGALIPCDVDNLLASGPCLGVTHITNGAYHCHSTQWNIGEAAGALAAFCLDQRCLPAGVQADPALLRPFQHHLLQAGIPLYWYEDMPPRDDIATAAHLLAVDGTWQGTQDHLRFDPAAQVSPAEVAQLALSSNVPIDQLGSNSRCRADLAKQLLALKQKN